MPDRPFPSDPTEPCFFFRWFFFRWFPNSLTSKA
jgi:hypothetical protein